MNQKWIRQLIGLLTLIGLAVILLPKIFDGKKLASLGIKSNATRLPIVSRPKQ